MRKSLSYKVLLSVLALTAINYALPANTTAGAAYDNYYVDYDGESVNGSYKNVYGNGYSFTINGGKIIGNVFGAGNGNKDYDKDAGGGNVTINGNAEVTGVVHGGRSYYGEAYNNTVNISGGSVTGNVFGGDSYSVQAHHNIVNISGGTVTGNVYGGWSTSSSANDNEIIISGSADIAYANLYGGYKDTDTGNTLTIDGWKGNNGKGDCTVNSLNNFESINFNNLINLAENTKFTVTDSVKNVGAVNINSIGAGDYKGGTQKDITRTLTLDSKFNTYDIKLADGIKNKDKYYTSERVNADGLFVNKYSHISVDKNGNTVSISAKVDKSALTGTFIDADGTVYKNSNGTPYNTKDDTTSLTIGDGFKAETDVVAGAYAAGSQTATGGIVKISGTTTWEGTVYAGYSEGGSASGNTINVLSATDAQNMTLSGGNTSSSGNTLNITGNGSTFNNIEDFDTINFNGIKLNGADVLTLQSANLNGTTLNVESLEGGNNYNAGDTVTLIKSADAITGTSDGINIDNYIVTAGVARDLEISTGLNADGKSIDMYVEDVSMNDQITLVAENRAVAAAFVNQGTDLISDSLDTISRDSNYGVKTFAAVHGNRSKYDVNSDIKINGWSVIAGVGNAGKFDNGSEFSWGVFYENGSGNYRTCNEFNNEFFRGDGSLVYNGGGIAARYTNKNGVYTEGSLRAGMLKSDMDNALRDGAGNFYGYESESAYYGAHIGIGKIISLSESSDLDVYGKFFHTYTEGDSFKVANDEFEFDSINSDRLRVGARITGNKENKFSTYYGLAYEYEFNGDADMTAQGLKAPTQSLQGSSIMAEVGFNYQPTPDSPWSFDLNMRGYTGERQGGSFNVQATYTF